MTELLHADAAGIARAVALLRAGQLVAFGTETVYGLGADATNDRAVAGIFAAKRRPRFNPLICHYPDADAAFADVVANARAQRLAATFWPGPLTLVLPRRRRQRSKPAGQRRGSIRWRCVSLRTTQRWRCCENSAGRSLRRPRTCPAK